MTLRLYNSLTRKIEPLKPLKANTFRIYACGPTVYSRIHIGNLRTYIAEDLLRRTLEFFGYRVKLVMNVTDVGHLTSDADTGEDKIEVAARKEHKTAQAITANYTELFLEDARRLNITRPTKLVKATDHIADQIEFIKALEEKGFSYRTEDGLYFDTKKLKGYGAFRPEVGGEAHRVAADPAKRHPADFSLWKFSQSGDLRQQEWDSPWGRGFPGWHIECSAMSTKYLGEEFDIHLGGIDHLSIHHENEIAQHEARFGHLPARHWFHVNFLVQKGEKMAKSTGNVLTLDELEAVGVEPLAFRLYVLHHHYRNLIEFDLEELKKTQAELNGIRMFLLRERSAKAPKAPEELKELLADDLNIPKLLDRLHREKNPALWLQFDQIFGLDLKRSTHPLSKVERTLIERRQKLRQQGEYRAADEIRAKLESRGIRIEDTEGGPQVFRRI